MHETSDNEVDDPHYNESTSKTKYYITIIL